MDDVDIPAPSSKVVNNGAKPLPKREPAKNT